METSAPPEPGDERRGVALPGLCNVHSHGFQRAMAGLTERRAAGRDDFWSWRELMYRFLERLTPEDVELCVGAAAQLGRGMTDTAGVESHEVEVLCDGAVPEGRGHPGDNVDGRLAGSARVDHQRTDPLPGGRNLDDGELGLRAVRLAVVDGHRHGRAPRSRNVAGIAEPLPAATPIRLRDS